MEKLDFVQIEEKSKDVESPIASAGSLVERLNGIIGKLNEIIDYLNSQSDSSKRRKD